MRRVPFVARFLMLLVALVCCARSARADTLWVTSGHVEAGFGALGQPWIGEALVLQGAGLDIVDSLEDADAFVQLATTPTVAPGALADFSGVLGIGSAIGARLHDEFGIVSAPITMSFNAAPAPLACSGDRELLECTGIAPFTFDADLTFTPLGGITVTQRLIGAGTLEGRLFRTQSFERGAVRYVFEATPVPEPATLSLFAAGAMMAGAGAWRRRHGGRSPLTTGIH